MIGAAVAILALVIVNVGTNLWWSDRIARQQEKINQLERGQDDLRSIILSLSSGQ